MFPNSEGTTAATVPHEINRPKREADATFGGTRFLPHPKSWFFLVWTFSGSGKTFAYQLDAIGRKTATQEIPHHPQQAIDYQCGAAAAGGLERIAGDVGGDSLQQRQAVQSNVLWNIGMHSRSMWPENWSGGPSFIIPFARNVPHRAKIGKYNDLQVSPHTNIGKFCASG